jgi:hypothetical protein
MCAFVIFQGEHLDWIETGFMLTSLGKLRPLKSVGGGGENKFEKTFLLF